MHNQPGLGANSQADSVHNGMSSTEELDFECPQGDLLSWAHLMQASAALQIVFFQFVSQQAEGQGRTVDRGIAQPFEQKGHGANVILVTMGQHQTTNVLDTLIQHRYIGNHQVDAEHVRLGKHQPTIDEQQFALVFQSHHVEANLAQPA